RKELDQSNEQQFDLKHGRGGIGDIEFIVQYLVLTNAEDHSEVIEFTDNIRQLDALASCRIIPPEAAEELQDIYRAYRRRQHHLVLNNEPVVLPPTEFDNERRAVIRHWDEAFRD
ncbi:MAG: bifunctional [glutamate--ammonia ligase]-adenylyl-L-tyrosine phosphorylase/[glutamate--ammonia-ligase] adenylyltransferase, partial [Woeseiaceae bacterium]|nr:bifunctional [glutamate--ammonia ligase]-adenylyl-L-tyrosine phosphorylase/[glutamate--ammonia-ligase] adenylyltransferase [Woeseiaceae bacterium]